HFCIFYEEQKTTDNRIRMLGLFFFSSRRRHTRFSRDWSSDVCSSDLRQHAAEEIDQLAAICRDHRATEVFTTDDPDEGEAFVAARRAAIPALEKVGPLLLEDVGVPLPQLAALVAGI